MGRKRNTQSADRLQAQAEIRLNAIAHDEVSRKYDRLHGEIYNQPVCREYEDRCADVRVLIARMQE